MSIRRRVEDADFLRSHGRADGALLSICAALSATSRRRYPKSAVKEDREAFTTFLGEELRVVTAGAGVNIYVLCPGANPRWYPDGHMPLQDVLYEFVRCALAHEGRIGANVVFHDDNEISFGAPDDRLLLGGGIVRRLLLVPQFAPENCDEFPELADMPPEVVGWHLFGQRRHAHTEYLAERQRRIEAIRSSATAAAPQPP